MTAPRTDFVQTPRAPFQDLDLHGSAYEVFHRLLIEADHRTGLVRGTERTIAYSFGIARSTYRRALAQLEGAYVTTASGTNQYTENGVQILNYERWVLGRAGTKSRPARESAGIGAGIAGGSEPLPAERADLQEQSYPQGDKTQDSVRSVRSLSRSSAAGAKGAPSAGHENWSTPEEEIEYKRSLVRRSRTEGQELQRKAAGDA